MNVIIERPQMVRRWIGLEYERGEAEVWGNYVWLKIFNLEIDYFSSREDNE